VKSNHAPCCGALLPPNNGGLANQHALLVMHLPKCSEPAKLVPLLNDVEKAMGLPPTPMPQTKAVQKWADAAMFTSVPQDASTGPEVSVLSFSPDPLGEIASAVLMYQGKPVKDLADITDDERRKAFAQVQATKLKAPFEFVKMHLLFGNVTRSWTHQLVRQRTAAYAQESLRFAVVEDGFATRVALPPSLAWANAPSTERPGMTVGDRLAEEYADLHPDSEQFARLSQKTRHLLKWRYANVVTSAAYTYLVNDGMPAEDARGLLPHNITTRVHYTTDLRALVDHAGNRLCTQAQFEWRTVFIQLVKSIREYGQSRWYYRPGPDMGGIPSRDSFSSAWQFDLIADLFRPACYLTGKCEFAAQDLDRKCSIRDRVDANHAAGRPSSFWHTHGNGNLKPINPAEWLADPGAAR
jgi:thymidylate synthase (FAD)